MALTTLDYQELLALGLGPEVIEAVARITDRHADAAKSIADKIAAKREKDAKRKRLARAALRGQSADASEQQGSFDKERSPTPSKEITISKTFVGNQGAREACSMPVDFYPCQKVIADPEVNRLLTAEEIITEVGKMREWALDRVGVKPRKKNWDQFARVWLRRAADQKARRRSFNGHRENSSSNLPKLAEEFGDLLRAKGL